MRCTPTSVVRRKSYLGGGRLKEKIRRAFTVKGVQEVWREKHAKEIQEITDVNSALTEEERQAAMAKLESEVAKSARIKVATNYGALAVVMTAVVGETLLIANPKWASSVENFSVKILGKDRKVLKPIGASARIARGGIDAIIQKAVELRAGVREKAASLRVDLDKRRASARNQLKNIDQKVETPISKVNLAEILTNLHVDEVDELNATHPFDKIVGKEKFFIGRLNTEIGNSQAEGLIKDFVGQARKFGKWQPILIEGGRTVGFQADLGFPGEGMDLLQQLGLVIKREVGGGRDAFVPTDKFIDFVTRALQQK